MYVDMYLYIYIYMYIYIYIYVYMYIYKLYILVYRMRYNLFSFSDSKKALHKTDANISISDKSKHSRTELLG